MKTIVFVWFFNLQKLLADEQSSAHLRIPLEGIPLEGYENIQNGTISESTLPDYIKSITESIQPDLALDRGYGAMLPYNVLNSTENYGCWCQGEILKRGHGEPQDQFDRICYHQYRGRECLRMDCIDRGEPCDVANQKYEFEAELIMIGNVPVELQLSCKEINENYGYCSRNKCLIDLRAMLEFRELIDNWYYPDVTTYGHTGFFDGRGSFDPSAENCMSHPGGTNQFEKECCGDYPFRNYYLQNQATPSMECCEYDDVSAQTVWNDPLLKIGQGYRYDSKQCCDSGVMDIGSSC